MEESTTPDVSLNTKRILSASREKLFESWTNPALIKSWFAPGDMDIPIVITHLKVGGDFRIVMEEPNGTQHTVTGTYTEIKKPERIGFNWSWQDSKQKETQVTVEFKDRLNGTELNLTHALFDSSDERDMHLECWEKCLNSLENVI